MSDKATLRRQARARRARAHEVVDAAPAQARLMDVLEGRAAPIAFYWPMRTEIDPRPVMEALAAQGAVCLPVTHGMAALSFRAWTPETVLETDDFGTSFPKHGADCVPATVIVPMLAFDRRGHRLGYGAGHYDRTLEALSAQSQIAAIGFAYSAQEVEDLPNEPTDQALDLIVTETETIVPVSH